MERRLFLLLLPGLAPASAPKSGKRSLRLPLWTQDADPVVSRQLKALVEGKAGEVTSLRTPSDDLLLLVVFDLVGDLSLVEPARESLIDAIAQLPANAWAGLLRAQDGLRVVLDPTADRAQFAEAVNSVVISGRPALLDTVEPALRLADSVAASAEVRLAVLYITDSNVYNYREDFTNPVINSSDSGDLSRRFPEGLIKDKISKVVAALGARQSPLFIVHLDYRNDRLNEAYQTGLMELAATTGGEAYICRSLPEIPEAIFRAVDMIRKHYVVGVELPPGLPATIGIELTDGSRSFQYRSRFHLPRK